MSHYLQALADALGLTFWKCRTLAQSPSKAWQMHTTHRVGCVVMTSEPLYEDVQALLAKIFKAVALQVRHVSAIQSNVLMQADCVIIFGDVPDLLMSVLPQNDQAYGVHVVDKVTYLTLPSLTGMLSSSNLKKTCWSVLKQVF